MAIMPGTVAGQHWPGTLQTSHFRPAFRKRQREATEAERLLATWPARIALLKRQGPTSCTGHGGREEQEEPKAGGVCECVRFLKP